MPRTAWRWTVAAVLTMMFTACGDEATSDKRGYTKAPLETVGLRIRPETPTDYRRFGSLNRPDGEPLVLADSASAG
jgi:hypothetical protein